MAETFDIYIEDDYSSKSIKVYGNDTKKYKAQFLKLGRWNPNLKDGPGYIISKNREQELNDLISRIESGEEKSMGINSPSKRISKKEENEKKERLIRKIKDTNIIISEYTPRSFKVTGTDTKNYYGQFKELGVWNRTLKSYMVSVCNKDALLSLADRIANGEEIQKPKIVIKNGSASVRVSNGQSQPLVKRDIKSLHEPKIQPDLNDELPEEEEEFEKKEMETQIVSWETPKPYHGQRISVNTGPHKILYKVSKLIEHDNMLDTVEISQNNKQHKIMVIVNGKWKIWGPYDEHEIYFM